MISPIIDPILQQIQRHIALLDEAVQSGTELHAVERQVFQMAQALGLKLVQYFLEQVGTGYQTPAPQSADGQPLSYKGTVKRSYHSVFGMLQINRAAYAKSDGGMVYPLDKQLNLPQGKHSYLLQDWIGLGAVETDYHDAVDRLNHIFGFRLNPYVAQNISADTGKEVEAFYDQQVAPSSETEGRCLAFSADGKGVRILRSEREDAKKDDQPKPRKGRGEKNGVKKQATVTVDFSFDPQPRQAHDVVKALLKKLSPDELETLKSTNDNRQAKNKHIRAKMDGKAPAMCAGMARLLTRDPTAAKPIIALIDGDPALEKTIRKAAKDAGLQDRIEAYILDIIHVSEYLWDAGTALHGEKGHARVKGVEQRLTAILEGKVGRVIGGLRQIITKNKPQAAAKKALNAAITYFDNHRHMMAYDTYLQKGYPIATGLVEGACGSFVKDRMEQSGMRWTIKGAQAMLNVRAVKKNHDWNDFWKFYTQTNMKNLYGH